MGETVNDSGRPWEGCLNGEEEKIEVGTGKVALLWMLRSDEDEDMYIEPDARGGGRGETSMGPS